MQTPDNVKWCLALAVAVLTTARTAHALGPVDVEVAGNVGTGTNPVGGPMNPLLLGVGGRAGIVYRHIYAGADFDYELSGYGDNGSVTFGGSKSFFVGARFGYGFDIDDGVVVRPQIGIGDYTVLSSLIGAAPPYSGVAPTPPNPYPVSNVYLEPGACLLLTFGHAMFGADANLLVLPGFGSSTSRNATDTALRVHLQAGVRF